MYGSRIRYIDGILRENQGTSPCLGGSPQPDGNHVSIPVHPGSSIVSAEAENSLLSGVQRENHRQQAHLIRRCGSPHQDRLQERRGREQRGADEYRIFR